MSLMYCVLETDVLVKNWICLLEWVMSQGSGKGESKYQKVTKFFQQHTYPIHLGLNNHQTKFQLIPSILRGPSSWLKIWAKLQRKSVPNISANFYLAITFELLQIFQFRFHGWHKFFLIFSWTPMQWRHIQGYIESGHIDQNGQNGHNGHHGTVW